jgi:hypothetical protein
VRRTGHVTRGLATLVLVWVAALASGTTPALAAGSARTTVPKYGISFVLPKGWNQVSLSPGDIGGLLGNASKVSSSIKSALTAQATQEAKADVKFFAVNPGLTANVNVVIIAGAASLGELDAGAKLGVASFGAKQVKTKTVHFRFGTAVEATYVVPLNNSAASLHGAQFYTAHGGHTYITTFTAPTNAENATAASTMMPTWKFKS